MRISTASGSERVSISRLTQVATLATARGTDPHSSILAFHIYAGWFI
jgi:hypothetical protein